MFWTRWSKKACTTCDGGLAAWALLGLGVAFIAGMGAVIGVASAENGEGAADGVWPALLAVFIALGASGGFFVKRCCKPRSSARGVNPPRSIGAPHVTQDGRRIHGDQW